MKFPLSLIGLALLAGSAHAADVNALLRVLKKDGTTVIGQAPLAAGGGAMAVIRVNAADALVAANGRCAFNVKYDEVSAQALSASTNRLYSNDTLIAQNTGLALAAGVLKTVWTQPYLYAGPNNVKVVLDATGAQPTTAWVRVEVAGACGATVVTPPPAASAPAPAPAPAAVWITPSNGGDWNRLRNAWGYSNYGSKQLQGKGYAGYAELLAVNAALTSAVNAGKIEQRAYQALMTRWGRIADDAAFKALMASIVPVSDRPASAPEPAPMPVPATVWIAPGSGDWNRLHNAWGYSNYGSKQLQGKGYAGYAELLAVNAALTSAVNAGKIEQRAYQTLMARWTAITNDPAFQAAMKAVVPPSGGV